MKSYFEIQVPSMTRAGNRGLLPGPVGGEPSMHAKGRLPGAVGQGVWKNSESRLLEETLAGGSITLELDHQNKEWRITPPAYARWQDYLPSTHGRWARSANEITVYDAIGQKVCFSLQQANRMSGRAYHPSSLNGRDELPMEWKRVPKPVPILSEPPIWYGLAIGNNRGLAGGPGGATVVVLSANRRLSFFMPAPVAGTSRGYFWSAAFVLLTGYLDGSDLMAHPGARVDYELCLGRLWFEQAGPLNEIVRLKPEALMAFALHNAETLRSLGMAAVRGTCVDYDEKHVIIAALAGAAICSSIYAHTGECAAV